MGRADEARVRQLLHNLLNNAIKRNPRSVTIQIPVRQHAGDATTDTTDDGPDMSSQWIHHVARPSGQVIEDAVQQESTLGSTGRGYRPGRESRIGPGGYVPIVAPGPHGIDVQPPPPTIGLDGSVLGASAKTGAA